MEKCYGYKVIFSDELYHHGIKGQKWGVRRFQNYDGTRTSKGKLREKNNRENNSEKKSKFHLTDKQKKYLKYGAIAVGTALAIYGAAYIYKHQNLQNFGAFTYERSDPLSDTLKDYSDKSISLKEGTVLQRVSREAIEDYTNKGETYVSYKFRDNQHYKYGLPREYIWKQKDAYVHKLEAKTNIKAPSSRELAKIYLESHPNAKDQDFRFVVQNGFVNYKQKDIDIDPIKGVFKKQANDLKTELLKRGYNAIIDIEDASNVTTQTPLILFNPSDVVNTKSVHKLGTVEKVIAKALR